MGVLFLITVSFSYVPHAEWILGLVLGSERSYQGAITTLFVIVMLLKTTFGGKSTAAHASTCAMPTKPFAPSCAMTPEQLCSSSSQSPPTVRLSALHDVCTGQQMSLRCCIMSHFPTHRLQICE